MTYQEIIRKHAREMLAELQESGVEALSLVGGVIIAPGENGHNLVHVFVCTDSEVTLGGNDVDMQTMYTTMMLDVGNALVRQGKEGKS